MMSEIPWKNCLESLYYLTLLATIFALASGQPDRMTWLLSLLGVFAIKELLNKTWAKDHQTFFDQRVFKFVDAMLLLLLMFVLYWSFRESENAYQILLSALPVLGALYSLWKQKDTDEAYQ